MQEDLRQRCMVREGDTFEVKNCYKKSGITKGKDGKEHQWVFFAPLDENGKRRFTMFAVNGDEAVRFSGEITVKKIVSAKLRTERGKDNPDRWYHDLTCDVVLEGTNINFEAEQKAAEEFEAFMGF